MCYKKIALTALSIAVLDGIFLNFLGPLFGKMVKKIQNSEMKVKETINEIDNLILMAQN